MQTHSRTAKGAARFESAGLIWLLNHKGFQKIFVVYASGEDAVKEKSANCLCSPIFNAPIEFINRANRDRRLRATHQNIDC